MNTEGRPSIPAPCIYIQIKSSTDIIVTLHKRQGGGASITTITQLKNAILHYSTVITLLLDRSLVYEEFLNDSIPSYNL